MFSAFSAWPVNWIIAAFVSAMGYTSGSETRGLLRAVTAILYFFRSGSGPGRVTRPFSILAQAAR